MSTTAHLPRIEQRVVLHGVSWETYQRLSRDCAEGHSAHFFFDRGTLEIMVLSFQHESQNRLLATIFEVVAEERGIDFENAGSTTFQHEDQERGFEGDTSFYVENAEAVRGKERLVLGIDPPPDVVIEVDVANTSVPKRPTFAAVRVPEVWHHDGETLTIWILRGGDYERSDASSALPGLTSADILSWLQKRADMRHIDWLKALRNWARTRFTPGGG